MNKRTPGPIISENEFIYEERSDGSLTAIARMQNAPCDIMYERAKLFAAAPELLEALQLVRDSTAVLNHLDSDVQQFICAAITKATQP